MHKVAQQRTRHKSQTIVEHFKKLSMRLSRTSDCLRQRVKQRKFLHQFLLGESLLSSTGTGSSSSSSSRGPGCMGLNHDSQLFTVCGPLPKTLNTCGPFSLIKILNFVLGFAISRQSCLVKASARGPRRTAPRSPRGGARTPFEKPSFRQFQFFSNVTLQCPKRLCR